MPARTATLIYSSISPPVVRYEWKRPGDLIHLDAKKLGGIRGVGHRITGVRHFTGRGIG
jgi:hypothetical protein